MHNREGIIKQSRIIEDLYITRRYNPEKFSKYIYDISVNREDRGLSIVNTGYCCTKLKRIMPFFEILEKQFIEYNICKQLTIYLNK